MAATIVYQVRISDHPVVNLSSMRSCASFLKLYADQGFTACLWIPGKPVLKLSGNHFGLAQKRRLQQMAKRLKALTFPCFAVESVDVSFGEFVKTKQRVYDSSSMKEAFKYICGFDEDWVYITRFNGIDGDFSKSMLTVSEAKEAYKIWA